MPSSICMKLMQYIFLNAIFSFFYLISIDNRDIEIKQFLKLWELWSFFENWTFFLTGYDVIGCWFLTAWKVLGWTLKKKIPLYNRTYQVGPTFSQSDPTFQFSSLKKSWKMNFFGTSNNFFRLSRYHRIRWFYQIFDILNLERLSF